jgi:hypothetical protein
MKLWPANFPDKRQVLKCAQADVLYDTNSEISLTIQIELQQN